MQVKSIIVVFAVLCLSAIVLAKDPAKPKPATSYTLSAFALTPNGNHSVRSYYDQKNSRARTDILDNKFLQVGEFIGLFEENKGHFYNSTTGQCSVYGLSSGWINTWDFLNNATFYGNDTFTVNKTCDLWASKLDKNMTLAACFNHDAPVFVGLYNGTQVNSLYFITHFEAAVDEHVFSLPSTCNKHSFKLSTLPLMNLKKFKVPAHPLLF
eukprot:TRINITY_DN12588_c0_g1_i1.p1 TRINITY_DN12588_c0_g1~~TRINITY_DN12588_c0_g1_i1.p1  ORF type:complete len:220 (-),score=68.57 TRINITY_DN12588_c0_g1_i1:111-743(-)